MNTEPETFSALLKGENSCLLTSLVCIKDEVILVDNENKKLKRFTTGKQFVDILTLNDPCGISAILLTSHVVVTEPKHKLITFVSTTGHLALSSRRKCSKKYNSVCCIDETRLAVGCCDVGESSVDIIDYIGTILKTVMLTLTREKIFKTPASLCCLKNKYLLVSDTGLGKLLGLTLDGKVDFEYDPNCTPGGVTVDDAGAIYLCLYDKNCVHRLRYENRKTDYVFSENRMKRPLAVAVSRKFLFVTEDSPSDIVSMFSIKEPENDKAIHLSQIQLCFTMDDEDDDD